MSNPGEINIIATRTRYAFVFGSDFDHWFRVFDGTFGYSDDRSAFYLRKLIFERSIRTERVVKCLDILIEGMVDYRRLGDFGELVNL